MDKIILLFLLTLLPIFELRLAIPLGILSGSIKLPILGDVVGFGMPWPLVFIVSVIANSLVVLPIFLFLDFLHHRFLVVPFYRNVSDFIIVRTQKKAKDLEPQINKYGYVALALFVGVPLPMTGAWTGALIAWLLGLNRKKSFIAISAGVVIAGVIVTLITLGGIGLFRITSS